MIIGDSLVAHMVKNLLAMQETRVLSLGQKDPLENGLAIHSNILAWRTPGLSSLAGYSPGGRKESDPTEHSSAIVIMLYLCCVPSPPTLI